MSAKKRRTCESDEKRVSFPSHKLELKNCLADCLYKFSLDLVHLIYGYLLYGLPRASVKPEVLHTMKFDDKSHNHFYGVSCSPENEIWICSKEQLQVFDSEGTFLRHIVRGGWKDLSNIRFAPNGNVYMTDFLARCLVVCHPNGTVFKRVATFRPRDVAFDEKHNLMFVTDFNNRRVQALTLDGDSVFHFGNQDIFFYPIGIAINQKDEVAVTDGTQDVQVFDCEGNFLKKFGIVEQRSGHGVCVNSANQWLVCNYLKDLIHIFSEDGSLVTSFGRAPVLL
jgi:DNA-binding beta-propeller fold protein YncE